MSRVCGKNSLPSVNELNKRYLELCPSVSVFGLKLIKMKLLTCQPTVLFYINQEFISHQAQLVYKGIYPFPPFFSIACCFTDPNPLIHFVVLRVSVDIA